ncbi:PepSY-like domain-containing protein [Fulvivirga sediminis]|uniref:PepSY-like domain-containing protein n=1 Tax=Fulvivirga sediminis TaxID=2803949 RepID=A0A937FAD5_9BACT|nr:PepSY-like domain-containing protein [Fulvivirga sediminis]MBL3656953.1 PepSY-like domain-containing protein [Fulvivirga sediminis]
MKNLLTILLVLCCAWANAQSVKVPEKVQKTFKSKFSKAEDVNWDKDDAQHYVANFYMDEAEQNVAYDQNGTWLYTSQMIDETELPEKITDKISSDFLDSSIIAAEHRTTSKNENLYLVTIQADEIYEEEMEDDEDSMETDASETTLLTFDANGKLLTKKSLM